MMDPEELQLVTTYQPALSFDDSLPKHETNCMKGTSGLLLNVIKG
jgi:hypothetical protein